MVVTGEALDTLREGGGIFQDGASLVRYYRSFIAEIAREKHDESGCIEMRIVLGQAGRLRGVIDSLALSQFRLSIGGSAKADRPRAPIPGRSEEKLSCPEADLRSYRS